MGSARNTVAHGAHISAAGGVPLGPQRAEDIGASAMQIFTKQPNRWAERDVEADEAKAFQAAVKASGGRFTNAHDSYLINLASPDPVLRAKSIESFAAELRRCHGLGGDACVAHPGNGGEGGGRGGGGRAGGGV